MRAALALVLALAACADDAGPTAGPLDDFVLTSPDGFVELVPTSTVDVAWTVTRQPSLSLQLVIVSGDEPELVIAHRMLAPGSFAWDGVDTRHQVAPPGNYQVRAIAVAPDDGTVDSYQGDNAHLIVVQGVRFRDGVLDFTGGQMVREVVVSTVARSTMELALVADPDEAGDGDELVLVTASIPGELVPFTRSYPFTGRTAAGAPVPGGDYRIAAVVVARGGTIQYRVDGPFLRWTP